MDANLTPEQKSVVTARPHGLLVSAAAGSGKTKVLVERLFYYVEEENADLDDFLIITFTEAAAAELRGKIIRHLNERLQEEPDNAHLQRQTLLVYRADIKTINGFCMGLLRENCHLMSEDAQKRVLRPDFRVVDGQEKEQICADAMRKALNLFFEQMDGDAGRTQLFETVGTVNRFDDSGLAELVRGLHGKLQAKPFVMQWIKEEKDRWMRLPARIEETGCGKIILADVVRKAEGWCKRFQLLMEEMEHDALLYQKCVPVFQDLCAQLQGIVQAKENGWDALREKAIAAPRFPIISEKKGLIFDAQLKEKAKKLKSACTDEMRKIFNELLGVSAAEAMEDLNAIAPAMMALLDLTADYTRIYQEEKRRRGVVDFSDQEHETLQLLYDSNHNPTPLAVSLSTRYREVMVDEYQDTNDAQNNLFDAITNYGDTLFCVGDVKQSIYRFRLANPRNFLDRYNAFPYYVPGETEDKAKICLSRNFRSRQEVLDATNFVFENILSKEMGEIEYGADERLYCGATYAPSTACEAEFHLIAAGKQTEEMPWSTAEYAAELVAQRIEKMMAEGFTVRGEQGERPLQQSDIAILFRYKTTFSVYQRVLGAHGLRCVTGEPSGNFYWTQEILVLYTLLCIIDNPRDDVSLVSVLRSPLFGLTPDFLAQLRAQTPEGDLYDALKASEAEEAHDFLALLARFRADAQLFGVRQLLAKIYDECNVLGIFGAMEGGEMRKNNLLTLLLLAEDFEKTGKHGLFPFLLQLRYYYENDDAKSNVNMAGDVDGIRLMSIHKSKGLEFPVVFLPQLESKFYQHDKDKDVKVVLHPDYGIGSVFVDQKRGIYYNTVSDRAIRNAQKQENLSEEMRLLYVAMTRAKEKLIMIYTSRNAPGEIKKLYPDSSLPVNPGAVGSGNCMGAWVMLPLLQRVEASPLRSLAGIEDCSAAMQDSRWGVYVHEDIVPQVTSVLTPQEVQDEKREENADLSLLDAVYPYAAETMLPAKITATQLKGRILDEEISRDTVLPPQMRALKTPQFISGETPLAGAERGTSMHAVMQYIDFSSPADEASVRRQVEMMYERKLLTEAQKKAADCRAIAAFLQSPVADRLRRGTAMEREYRFSLLRKANIIFPQASGEDELMLQGVVDCFWVEDGALVVLDFKTDRVSASHLRERAESYRVQLDTYAEALGEIMKMPVREKLLYFFETGDCIKL